MIIIVIIAQWASCQHGASRVTSKSKRDAEDFHRPKTLGLFGLSPHPISIVGKLAGLKRVLGGINIWLYVHPMLSRFV